MQPTKTAKKTGAKKQIKTGQIRTQKAGSGTSGKRVRQAAFLVVLKEQRIFNVRRACADAGISRTQFYDWLKKDKRFQVVVEDIIEGRKDDFEEDLQKQSRAGDSRSTTFFLERKCRDRGYGKETDSTKLAAILKRAKEGEISPLDAAYEVNMLGLPLPEVLRLQLSKNEPMKPPGDEEYRAPTVEEIERRAQEALESVQKEKAVFLPLRREEVVDLKQQMKNLEQFGPGVTDEE